jgi:hypothetical protein
MEHHSLDTAYSPSRIAKDFQKLLAFVGTERKLSWCQELAARSLGGNDWYDLTRKAGQSSVAVCDWTEMSTRAMEDFGVSSETARYLVSPYSKPIGGDRQSLVSVLDAIAVGAVRDHFTISLDPQSDNFGKISFHYPGEDECRWEPIHRPVLIERLKLLWERSPSRMRGDTLHHQYYVGGANRWKIDAYTGNIALVWQLGR